jgi:hypothetical protein
MTIDKRWELVQQVPKDRLKEISFGALRGKSDINPQWRIKAITEVYGLCGIGWYYTISNVDFRPSIDGKIAVFVEVNLFVKDADGEWSKPIPGVGGNMFVDKNKNGLVDNDEAVKMATTDALGNAMKYIGVASQIFEGDFDGSKYNTPRDATSQLQNTDTTIYDNLRASIKEKPESKEFGIYICAYFGVSRLIEIPINDAKSIDIDFQYELFKASKK